MLTSANLRTALYHRILEERYFYRIRYLAMRKREQIELVECVDGNVRIFCGAPYWNRLRKQLPKETVKWMECDALHHEQPPPGDWVFDDTDWHRRLLEAPADWPPVKPYVDPGPEWYESMGMGSRPDEDPTPAQHRDYSWLV